MDQTPKPNVFALENSTGSKQWRLLPHLAYLKSLGWGVHVMQGKGRVNAQEIEQAINWCDIVIFQSVFDNRIADLIKEKGKKLVFEFDDLIDEVAPSHPMAATVNTKEWRLQVHKVMEMSDVVIVTNENLKKRFDTLNPNINVYPNYMDIPFWDRPYNPNTNTDQIRLGWAGGISHQDDLEWIAPVIKRVLDKYPQVKFIYCGDGGAYAKDKMTTFNYGKDHFIDLPVNRREYVMGSVLESYPDKINSLQLDIAIAPLVLNAFSACKTPIKWMEYGINQVPCVGQGFMYKTVIDDGENGLLAHTPEEWFNKISLLIENPDMRRRMGEKARTDVLARHASSDHLDQWVDIILSR